MPERHVYILSRRDLNYIVGVGSLDKIVKCMHRDAHENNHGCTLVVEMQDGITSCPATKANVRKAAQTRLSGGGVLFMDTAVETADPLESYAYTISRQTLL